MTSQPEPPVGHDPNKGGPQPRVSPPSQPQHLPHGYSPPSAQGQPEMAGFPPPPAGQPGYPGVYPQVQYVPVPAQPTAFPDKMVTKQRRHTSHGLHLFLTIITFGTWGIFVWLPITLWHKMGPREKIVTRYR